MQPLAKLGVAQIVNEKNRSEQNFEVHANKYLVEESLRVKISPRVIIALKPFSNIWNKLEIWKYCLYWVGANHSGLYSKALPKRGTFFRLLVYEREVISLVEVHERVGKSVIVVCKKAQKG